MKFPDGFLWGYPGFPSIMVSYLKTNDFFYSGHCGLPIVLLCEFRLLKMNIMSGICLFTFFLETFTMLTLRGHYTIDVIAGAIFAHYIWDNTKKYSYLVDNLTFNSPKENQNDLKIEEINFEKSDDKGNVFIRISDSDDEQK